MLLTDGRISEAMEAVSHCDASTFQPSELFPLFPSLTRHWEDFQLHKQVTKAKITSDYLSMAHFPCWSSEELVIDLQYWGLHGPLEPLEDTLRRHPPVSKTYADPRHHDGALALAEQAIAQYLLQVC